MKNTLWNRPKKIILNIILSISALFFVLTLSALFVFLLWQNAPTAVAYIDKNIPDSYGNKMSSLYSKAVNSKDEYKQYQAYLNLYGQLKEVGTLHRFYNYRQEALSALIEYYASNNMLVRAVELANTWRIEYPNDFIAKFKYVDTLALHDKEAAKKYYESLYARHKKIPQVIIRFEKFLSMHGYVDRANALKDIIDSSDISRIGGATLYYVDGKYMSFNEHQKITGYANKNYKSNYVFSFRMKFNDLRKMRFDLNGVDVGTLMYNPKAKISIGERSLDNVKVNPANDIGLRGDVEFIVEGNDPYFYIELPEDMRGFSGDMRIDIQVDLGRSSLVDEKIIGSPEWKFFYKNENNFNEADSLRVVLVKENNGYEYSVAALNKRVSSVRLDLPSKNGLNVHKLEIVLNHIHKLDNDDVYRMHMVGIIDGHYKVLGKDPYIIYKLNDVVLIDELHIKLML